MTPLLAAMSALVTVRCSTVHAAALRLHRDGVAADRLGGLHLDDVGRHDLAGHDVIREDPPQLRLVLRLEQILHRARRQLGERLVGRREHRERARRP